MNTLKKLNEAEVTSSDGFKVKYGRDTLTYMEGKNYLVIPIEHLGAPYEMVVYLNMVDSWMEQGRAVNQVSIKELDLVEKRIQNCLIFLKRNFSIKR